MQSGGTSTQDPVPENAAHCHPLCLDASITSLSDPETAADKAKYLADMHDVLLMELEREHSATDKQSEINAS